ncbi:MAG: hypothetical protein R3C19_08330 [Planctomycetaceae bacterium]
MRIVRSVLFGLFLSSCMIGCGGSNDPVIPENPTAGPPGGGPSKDGLPSAGGMPQK